MELVSIVGYATMMSPSVAKGLDIDSDPEPVWIEEHQRFFGIADPNLDQPNNGATTVIESPQHRYNAVIYRNVPGDIVDKLDRIESEANLDRVQLETTLIKNFFDESEWDSQEQPVYVYQADPSQIRLDVMPNADYLQGCRRSSDIHGSEFRAAYEETTFLADRRTTLSESGF